jgi:hypothetical protein
MPSAIYRIKNGSRVPGASTISKIGEDSGGLVHAAWQLGVDGLDYREAWGEKARIGSIGHVLMQHAIMGTTPTEEDFPTDGARDVGKQAFSAYQTWREQTKIRWVDTEIALVSEKHRYGGTIDAVGIPEGSNSYVIGDWKTGGLYPSHLCQLAGYGHLFTEVTGHPVVGYHLCRFDRDTGDFTHAYFNEASETIKDAWSAFLHKRALYDLNAKLKKRV